MNAESAQSVEPHIYRLTRTSTVGFYYKDQDGTSVATRTVDPRTEPCEICGAPFRLGYSIYQGGRRVSACDLHFQVLSNEPPVTTSTKPMSDAQLQAAQARKDVPALLAEMERLRAENAAMREVVHAVAHEVTLDDWFCKRCISTAGHRLGKSWEMVHEPSCIVIKARDLVNHYGPPSTPSTEPVKQVHTRRKREVAR